ncbi:hypothetical protein CDAR_78251 [Caerostris darwini]|uniref:Uncharacterized protein n=1 Tax=Caerostris darwini TaxID=1538125 RepID=A0AAV4SAG5_9ARAC|nr:hypothetical protein CDAR_78251 [Caerostris darwini]
MYKNRLSSSITKATRIATSKSPSTTTRHAVRRDPMQPESYLIIDLHFRACVHEKQMPHSKTQQTCPAVYTLRRNTHLVQVPEKKLFIHLYPFPSKGTKGGAHSCRKILLSLNIALYLFGIAASSLFLSTVRNNVSGDFAASWKFCTKSQNLTDRPYNWTRCPKSVNCTVKRHWSAAI